MKALIIFFKILLIVALFLDMFLWLAAHASGHKIPITTDWWFGLSSLILILILLSIAWKITKSTKTK